MIKETKHGLNISEVYILKKSNYMLEKTHSSMSYLLELARILLVCLTLHPDSEHKM